MSPARHRSSALLVLTLAACMRPAAEAPIPPGSRPFDAASTLRAGGHAPLAASWRHARPGPPPPADDGFLDPLGASLSGGTFDDSYGAALVEALAEEDPADVDAYGAGTFTLTELFGGDYSGTEGLCEDPHALFHWEEDGVEWETSLLLYGLLQLTEPVTAIFTELSETCAEAVDRLAGDVETAVDEGSCTEQESRTFFDEDEACYACVGDGNSVADCQDSGECLVEAPARDSYSGRWYRWAESTVLACAPNVTAKLYLASNEITDDGAVPEAWNQTDWPWLCFGIRDEDSGEVERNCVGDSDGYADITDGYGQGIIGRIDYLREAGSSETPHPQRVIYARRMSFDDGTSTSEMVLSFGGTGQISAPLYAMDGDGDGDVDDDDWGYGYGGYGFSPIALRPDGTDLTDINDTYARDWLAAVVTKMSTTRNGVPINDMNYSRCEVWAGPHDDGSYTCIQNGSPKLGWFADNHVFWYNRQHTLLQAETMMTLGSTGLPDELVPGGFATHVAGTADLANPDWDDCTWPHSFVPDHIRTEDTPMDWGGTSSMDAHTYKFGKDPDQDLRLVLATPQARGFCPSEE